MATGKPIIGAINGICNNFIVNNQVGYSVSFGDYQALANLISKLDETELKQIGKNSKDIYEEYSKTIFITRLVNELNHFVK